MNEFQRHRMAPLACAMVGGAIALLLAVALVGCSESAPKIAAPPAGTAATAATATTSAADTATATYDRDANATLEALATAAASVADTMAKADPQSASWRASLDTNVKALNEVKARAERLKPPAARAEVHAQLVEVAGDFARAAQLISGAIEPVDVDALQEASQILTAAVTKTAALRAALPVS